MRRIKIARIGYNWAPNVKITVSLGPEGHQISLLQVNIRIFSTDLWPGFNRENER